jgi:hypothetical protein
MMNMMQIETKKNLNVTHSLNDRHMIRDIPAPRKIATPPREGVNVECILCSPEESNNFHCLKILINTGKIKNEIRKEMEV